MSVRYAGLAVAGTLCLVASLSLAGTSIAGGDGPTTIGLRNGASEFSFALTRTKVVPGPALIQYTNTGEDPHDVLIQRNRSDEVVAIGETEPGEVNAFPVIKLKQRSKYTLWCSLEGHQDAGMDAELKVKRRKRR